MPRECQEDKKTSIPTVYHEKDTRRSAAPTQQTLLPMWPSAHHKTLGTHPWVLMHYSKHLLSKLLGVYDTASGHTDSSWVPEATTT